MKDVSLITERKSIRKYKDEIVPRDVMNDIMEVTKYTQSWANYQVARFTFVTNKDIIKKLATEGVNGFIYNASTLENASNVAVLSFIKGKSGSLSSDKGEVATQSDDYSWEIFDAGIACQTFCLSAHAYGVGTCVMGVIDAKNIAEIIGLPSDQMVGALIPYGYSDGSEPRETKRKTVDKLATYLD